jgi:hypothetical protein
MTKYFQDDNDVPEDFPWESWAAFEKDLEDIWEDMKSKGVRLGKLEVTPEGFLKGHGHPDDWFNAVCKDK